MPETRLDYVASVQVAEVLSHADTLEISCHSLIRELLPALEFIKGKRYEYASYRSYSTNVYKQNHWSTGLKLLRKTAQPNKKNIYGATLALIAIMNGIMQSIIAVASLLATMALYGNSRDPQWCMSGIPNMYYSYLCSLIGQSTIYL